MNEELTYYLIIFLGIILGAVLSFGVLTILNKVIGHKEKQGQPIQDYLEERKH